MQAVAGLLKTNLESTVMWWNSPSEGVSTYAWKSWEMVFEIGQAIYITLGKHTLKFSFGKLKENCIMLPWNKFSLTK